MHIAYCLRCVCEGQAVESRKRFPPSVRPGRTSPSPCATFTQHCCRCALWRPKPGANHLACHLKSLMSVFFIVMGSCARFCILLANPIIHHDRACCRHVVAVVALSGQRDVLMAGLHNGIGQAVILRSE